MTGPISNDDAAQPEASAVFAEFLGRRERGEAVDFEDLLARNPRLADELRLMYSDAGQLHQLARDADLAPYAELAELESLAYDPVKAARAFAERLAPGRDLGGYVLRRKLAEGGMGQVWEAEQVALGRAVAVKVIRPDRMSPLTLARFRREARANARLRHPNIVSIYTHGTTDGVAWLAMELVEGGRTLYALRSLDSPGDAGGASYCRAVARTFQGIAEGMAAAHSKGIVHRDLKPENVLLDAQDRPRITDFGLAMMEDDLDLSSDSGMVGTMIYMSPEQVSGRRDELDGRSDVFSLGAMLFEMVAQEPPFGRAFPEVCMRISERPHADLTTLRPGVPRDLALIVDRCLEKDPERRYRTMEELAEDLRRFVDHEPVSALPPVLFERYEVLAVVLDDDAQRVVRCLDRQLQREVVLEAPGRSIRRVATADGTSRALREAQLLAALECPGLPRVHDVLQDEGGPVLVLESVGGELLSSRIARSGPLAAAEIARLALDLAQILARVHAARAVHRALSTKCVLLREDGPAVLRGFRFAKTKPLGFDQSSLSSQRERARQSEQLRTILPPHPAPEQFGDSQANPSTDLFALGCVLYEAATGRTACEDHYGQAYSAPPPVRSLAPQLDRRLAAVIDACLARAPAGRPSSARAIVQALSAPRWARLFGWRRR